MNKTLKLVFLLLMVTAPTLYASEAKPTGYAETDLFSKYVWRGQGLSDGVVVQPSVGVEYKNFGFNVWINYDIDEQQHNETDVAINYVYAADQLEVDLGYIQYVVHKPEMFETGEAYLSLSYDTVLNPSLAIYYDLDEGDGAFIETNLGHSVELSGISSFNIAGTLSYNAKNNVMGTNAEGIGFSDFYHAEIAVSFSLMVSDDLIVEPMIAYTFSLSDKSEEAIKDASSNSASNTLYGGVNLSLNF